MYIYIYILYFQYNLYTSFSYQNVATIFTGNLHFSYVQLFVEGYCKTNCANRLHCQHHIPIFEENIG